MMKNTYCCGTARPNCRGFPTDLKILTLKKRGEYKAVLVENAMVECVAWQDKKTVKFINTISLSTEQSEVKRKNKDGSSSMVACLQSVKNYNQYMGGVDMADAKRKVYSCSRKSVKWWHYFIIDVCIVNAHILQVHTRHSSSINQKSFCLELSRELLSSHCSRKSHKRGRSSMEGAPSLTKNV